MKECLKCGKELTGKQIKYCSEKCCTLYLKSLYKKRNPDKSKNYKLRLKEAGFKPLSLEEKRSILKHFNYECPRCKSRENLNIHHIIPAIIGGKNDARNLLVLCFKCHMELEQRMKNYWSK